MTKAHLIEVAQPHCDSSFTAPTDPTKFYTAWNSMKTLIQKDLVYEHGRPLRKYALSEEGWEVAKRIQKTLPGSTETMMAFAGSHSRSQPTTSDSTAGPAFHGDDEEYDDAEGPATLSERLGQSANPDSPTEPISLPPNSFTVELILDTREVRTSKDRDYIANELVGKGITPQVRALELGDAMWVAKCRDPSFLARHGEDSDEVMLDWIVERKRLDDLIGSIKDGRFHEQKFRLRRSGIKNVIYLVEEFTVVHADAGSGNGSKYQDMVASAIASTQVVNGYFMKKTRNLDDSIRYLARMTFLLRRMYGVLDSSEGPNATSPPAKVSVIPSRRLSSTQSYLTTLDELRLKNPSVTFGVTFSTFSLLTSKSDLLSLRDVFLKMLMCIRGVTGEKAIEIQKRWKTPRELVQAYMAMDPKDRETMVSDKMESLVARKKIQKALSKRISEIWGQGR